MNTDAVPDTTAGATAEPKVISALMPARWDVDNGPSQELMLISLRFITNDGIEEDGMPQSRLQIRYNDQGWEDAFMPGAAADVVAMRPGMVTKLDGHHLHHGHATVELSDSMGAMETTMVVATDDVPLLGTLCAVMVVAPRPVEKIGGDDAGT